MLKCPLLPGRGPWSRFFLGSGKTPRYTCRARDNPTLIKALGRNTANNAIRTGGKNNAGIEVSYFGLLFQKSNTRQNNSRN